MRRAIAQARGALTALAELLPDEAQRVIDDGTETVTLASLAVGDHIRGLRSSADAIAARIRTCAEIPPRAIGNRGAPAR